MNWRHALAVFCFLSAPMAASGQTAPIQPIPEGDRDGFMWLVRPSALPLSMFFPRNATEQNVVGRVLLDCRTRIDQRLDCEAVEETPTGWGFSEAAIGISHSFRAMPGSRDGRLIGGLRASVPINFRMMTDYPAPQDGQLDLPEWEAAPNAEAVRAAWREGATQPNVRGRAVLSCTVRQDRTLDCVLARESREGLGLGRAAVALSTQFKVSEHDTGFVQRHGATPFYLPVNFGFDAAREPLNRITSGMSPFRFPAPPPAVVRTIYPHAARDTGVPGDVTVTCTVRDNATPDCVVTSETPTGQGFGNAALGLIQASARALLDLESFLPGDQIEFTVPFDPETPNSGR
jgi:hypothetical protein